MDLILPVSSLHGYLPSDIDPIKSLYKQTTMKYAQFLLYKMIHLFFFLADMTKLVFLINRQQSIVQCNSMNFQPFVIFYFVLNPVFSIWHQEVNNIKYALAFLKQQILVSPTHRKKLQADRQSADGQKAPNQYPPLLVNAGTILISIVVVFQQWLLSDIYNEIHSQLLLKLSL